MHVNVILNGDYRQYLNIINITENMTDITKKIGVSVSIGGIVQGVGFRPFVHRLVADFFCAVL